MANTLEEEKLKSKVNAIVESIPRGFVLTYGTIAFLAGIPRNARLVGRLLARAPEGLPAHRVVNHKGATVPNWNEQTSLLQSEGVTFKKNGCVDIKRHLWRSGNENYA